MYWRFFITLFFTTVFSVTHGQKKTDTLRFYFNINEYESSFNNKRIDSTLSALKNSHHDVAIYGYADFLSNNRYNDELSSIRAKKIKNRILSHAYKKQFNVYVCEGKGETGSVDNSSAEGEPKQRRVDVVFESVPVMHVPDSKLQEPIVNNENKTTDHKPKEFSELKTGESLALAGLSFEPGRHFILKESAPVLQKLLQVLTENQNLKIEIRGHVCCTLNGLDGLDLDTKEMKLSHNRAKAIYDYLVGKGINKSRLSYVGLGRKEPLFPNEYTSEEEQANRRVEIKIIEK